jgi:hypothetical protein
VPPIVVPDNTKTAVTRSPAYTVLINASYDELATHYGFAVIPARPRKPNDKALVENAVNIVERSVLAALRGRTFFALDELNDAIAEKVDQINAAPFQRRPGTRLEIFDEEERPLLRPLPLTRFELATYRTAKVAPDSHVQVETMRYSVPYRLVGKTCDIRLTPDRIEVMHGGRRVADHGRLYGRKGQYSTNAEHMPPNHAAYDAKWTPERYQRWADGVGPGARKLVDRVLSGKRIVEQTFVPCMNILGLAKKGRRELLEEACLSLAESPVTPTYSLVKNTMEAIKAKKNLDAATAPRRSDMKEDTLGDAGCVRGSDYYRSGEDDDDDI